MPQIFHPVFNVISKASIFGSLFVLALILWFGIIYTRSSYGTDEWQILVQPIPFSHEHHAGTHPGGLAIDCRYCHTTVEESSFAGMPATKTCMNCHSQIWVGSTMLEPVRESYRTGQPIHWRRVHNLPGFVYFDHSIHIAKGVGCVSCHGRVDQMPFVFQAESLLMEWCLDCHRQPERHVRPRDEVFNMTWEPPGGDQLSLGRELVKKHRIRDSAMLTSCTTCHR
jgi:hypothetical protein